MHAARRHAERRQAALALRAEHDLAATGTPRSSRSRSPARSTRVGGKVAPIQATTAAAQAAHPGFTIAEAGDGSFSKAYDDTQGKDFQKAEQLSLPITLLILVIAFGGLLIAGIPVALAMSAVFAALGLTAVASQLLPVTDVDAVGDPADRPRRRRRLLDLLHRPRAPGARARRRARSTRSRSPLPPPGRAVLVSGLTVMAAMSGMFLAGNGVFSGIALATILVVATAIIGSLTVLPALLAPEVGGLPHARPGPRRDGSRVPLRRPRHRRRLGLRHLAVPHAAEPAPARPRRDDDLAARPAPGAASTR